MIFNIPTVRQPLTPEKDHDDILDRYHQYKEVNKNYPNLVPLDMFGLENSDVLEIQEVTKKNIYHQLKKRSTPPNDRSN